MWNRSRFAAPRRAAIMPFAVAGWLSLSLVVSASCRSADTGVSASAMPFGAVQGDTKIITDFSQPFLFTYLSWENKIKTENGVALLRGEGVTPKGGGGGNVELDLSKSVALCPVVRVKVGAKNTLKTLKLSLLDDSISATTDAEKRGATFDFPIPPKPTDGFVTIYPLGGATLAKPNALGAKGNINPAKIKQWQMQGDFGGDGAVDIEVDSITLAEPDAASKTAQAKTAAQDAAAQEKAKADRAAMNAKYGKRTTNSPNVVEVYRVAPDIVAVGIQAGKVVITPYEPYVKQPGDQTRQDGEVLILTRGGKEIGYVIGVKKDGFKPFETFVGDPLLDDPAEDVATYSIVPDGGGTPIQPMQVWRKSKPTDQVQPGGTLALRHIVYLKLPAPLASGKKFTVKFGDALNVQQSTFALSTNDATVRSEAVHAPQIGYRPDDPVKVGFLSVWLGTGGAYEYPTAPKFAVVDAKTGKTVLSGTATLTKAKNETDKMWQGKADNYAKTAVYALDYSALQTPGTYRVSVAGVGASYPFTVGADTWKKAFVTQMRGLFHQRSGVALGEPYTSYKRPRDLYPGDDVQAFETKYNVVDGGKAEDYEALAKMGTTIPVPQAWGGYHDAGDFNPRRVTHMKVTLAHLELLDIFPAYFEKIKLNIPPKSGVPDVLTEALFELDLFRRLQKSDGGVPYEIETNGDPSPAEVSWKQVKTEYVTAPDPWASWYYAGVAARAAKLLQKYDPALAATYKTSALKAMAWGEADYQKRKANGTADKIHWDMKDARNYAALACYDLTGEAKWLSVFMEDTLLKEDKPNLFQWGTGVQKDAAFLYATLSASRKPDATLKARAVAGLKAQAESSLAYAAGNAFRLTTPDPGKPMFIGFWSTPDAIELCRSHFLTGDKKYLAGAVQACAFASGGNPNNITYTTGVGANPVAHPFQIDYRATGQPPPDGLTVYGNFDWRNWPDQAWALWPMQYSLGPNLKPGAYEWPVTEAYFDIYLYPAIAEYTVDAWAPNVYVWGYLAARP